MAAPVLVGSRAAAGAVQLGWVFAGAAEVFELERSVDGAPFAPLARYLSDAREGEDQGAPSGAAAYRLRAADARGAGPWSNVVNVPLVPTNAWPTLGGDVRHTGYNALETGFLPEALSWSFATKSAPGPFVTDGRLAYFTSGATASARDTLLAVDLADGGVAWSHAFTNVDSIGQPAAFDGQVYLAQGNGERDSKLLSFDRAGDITFAAPFQAQWDRFWAPIRVGRFVYTNAGVSGGLFGFDAHSGARVFAKESLEDYDQWSAASDGAFVYTFIAGHLRAHDPRSGAVVWTTTVPWTWTGWSMETSPVIADGLAFVIAPPVLYAIDLATHAVRWSASGLNFKGTPAVAKGIVYAISAGTARAHDAQTGAFLWSFDGDRALRYPPVLTPTHLFAASDKNVYAVDLVSHTQVWHAAGGGWLSVAAGRLFVAGAPLVQVWALVVPPPPDSGTSLCFADDAGWPGGWERVAAEQGTELAAGFPNATAIAVSGSNVYFTVNDGDGGVMTMPTTGGAPTTLASTEGNASGLAVDQSDVYWSSTSRHLIGRVPLDGGWPGFVALNATTNNLAVDQAWVYWTEATPDGPLFRAPLSGGWIGTELFGFDRATGPLVVDGLSLYWTAKNTAASLLRGSIEVGSVSGSPPSGVIAFGDFNGGSLVLDATNLYWSDRDLTGAIWTMPRRGGTPTVLATNQHLVGGLALDGPWVYWTTGGPCGGVKKMRRTGGDIIVLASQPQLPPGGSSVAVDATHVYWTTGPTNGTVRRVAK